MLVRQMRCGQELLLLIAKASARCSISFSPRVAQRQRAAKPFYLEWQRSIDQSKYLDA